MKTGSFEHLEQWCAAKGIVVQRIGKRIELTTPCGGTTAEETSVRDAWGTVKTDPAFCHLPIQVRRPVAPEPQPVRAAREAYRYRFLNSHGEIHGPEIIAVTLDEAMTKAGFGQGWTVAHAFHGMAVITYKSTGTTLGAKWEPV